MNNKENAEKFLEKNGIPPGGPNFKNRLIETMVNYAENITLTSDVNIDYGVINDTIPNIVTFDFFKEAFKEIVADSLGCELEKVTDNSNLKDDLGCDILDYFEIIIKTEKKLSFSISDEEMNDIEVEPFSVIAKRLYEIYKK